MKHSNKLVIGISAVIILLIGVGAVLFYSDSDLLTGAVKKRRRSRTPPPQEQRDATRPTVELVTPESRATVGGITEISVNATDNVGVTRVEFEIDNQIVGNDDSAPYTYSWDTTTVSNGSHDIKPRAYDAAGNSTDVRDIVTVFNELPDTTPPTVELSLPVPNATVNGAVGISVNTSDDVAVTRVEFLIDGNVTGIDGDAPFSYNWDSTRTTDGEHTISARAHDAASNSSETEPIAVTVNNIPDPAIIELGDNLPSQGTIAENNVPLIGFYVSAGNQDARLQYVRFEYGETGILDLNVYNLTLYKNGQLFRGHYEIRDAPGRHNYRGRVDVENATVPMLIDFRIPNIRAGTRDYFELRAGTISDIDSTARQCITVSLENFSDQARSVCNDVPTLQIGRESMEPETTRGPADTSANVLLYDFTASASGNIDAIFRKAVLKINKTPGVSMENIRLLSSPRWFQYTVTDSGDSITFELSEPHVIPAGTSRDYSVWVRRQGGMGDSMSVELEGQPESRRNHMWQ